MSHGLIVSEVQSNYRCLPWVHDTPGIAPSGVDLSSVYETFFCNRNTPSGYAPVFVYLRNTCCDRAPIDYMRLLLGPGVDQDRKRSGQFNIE